MAEDGADRSAAVLAIDGGNSKTDVALIAVDGTLLASVRGPGASHEDFVLPEAMRRLGETVRRAADRADLPAEEAQLTAAIQHQGWSLTSAVANDTFAVLRDGLTPAEGERPWGIAVTCGAGINCVGVGPDGLLKGTELSGDRELPHGGDHVGAGRVHQSFLSSGLLGWLGT